MSCSASGLFAFVMVKTQSATLFFEIRFPLLPDVEDMRKTSCGAVTPASYFSSLLVV